MILKCTPFARIFKKLMLSRRYTCIFKRGRGEGLLADGIFWENKPVANHSVAGCCGQRLLGGAAGLHPGQGQGVSGLAATFALTIMLV